MHSLQEPALSTNSTSCHLSGHSLPAFLINPAPLLTSILARSLVLPFFVHTAACLMQLASGSKEPLSIMHRKAEDTRLPAGSFDVVSMCLVAHELPQHATKAILKEAHR
jgi:hypothetical protein